MRRRVALAGVCVLMFGSIFVGFDARAGLTEPDYEFCESSSTGGECVGTMAGFRNSSYSSDYADFSWDFAAGDVGFSAVYKGVLYTCFGSYSSVWIPAVTDVQWFTIIWNASGTCEDMALENGSYYSAPY
jgi:hypothetical protein